MNKRFIIFVVILVPVVLLAMHKIYISTDLHEIYREMYERVKTDQDYARNYKIIVGILSVISLSVNSVICFKIAKKKNKDPQKWARYGLLFNIWAILYLLFFVDNDDTTNT